MANLFASRPSSELPADFHDRTRRSRTKGHGCHSCSAEISCESKFPSRSSSTASGDSLGQGLDLDLDLADESSFGRHLNASMYQNLDLDLDLGLSSSSNYCCCFSDSEQAKDSTTTAPCHLALWQKKKRQARGKCFDLDLCLDLDANETNNKALDLYNQNPRFTQHQLCHSLNDNKAGRFSESSGDGSPFISQTLCSCCQHVQEDSGIESSLSRSQFVKNSQKDTKLSMTMKSSEDTREDDTQRQKVEQEVTMKKVNSSSQTVKNIKHGKSAKRVKRVSWKKLFPEVFERLYQQKLATDAVAAERPTGNKSDNQTVHRRRRHKSRPRREQQQSSNNNDTKARVDQSRAVHSSADDNFITKALIHKLAGRSTPRSSRKNRSKQRRASPTFLGSEEYLLHVDAYLLDADGERGVDKSVRSSVASRQIEGEKTEVRQRAQSDDVSKKRILTIRNQRKERNSTVVLEVPRNTFKSQQEVGVQINMPPSPAQPAISESTEVIASLSPNPSLNNEETVNPGSSPVLSGGFHSDSVVHRDVVISSRNPAHSQQPLATGNSDVPLLSTSPSRGYKKAPGLQISGDILTNHNQQDPPNGQRLHLQKFSKTESSQTKHEPVLIHDSVIYKQCPRDRKRSPLTLTSRFDSPMAENGFIATGNNLTSSNQLNRLDLKRLSLEMTSKELETAISTLVSELSNRLSLSPTDSSQVDISPTHIGHAHMEESHGEKSNGFANKQVINPQDDHDTQLSFSRYSLGFETSTRSDGTEVVDSYQSRLTDPDGAKVLTSASPMRVENGRQSNSPPLEFHPHERTESHHSNTSVIVFQRVGSEADVTSERTLVSELVKDLNSPSFSHPQEKSSLVRHTVSPHGLTQEGGEKSVGTLNGSTHRSPEVCTNPSLGSRKEEGVKEATVKEENTTSVNPESHTIYESAISKGHPSDASLASGSRSTTYEDVISFDSARDKSKLRHFPEQAVTVFQDPGEVSKLTASSSRLGGQPGSSKTEDAWWFSLPASGKRNHALNTPNLRTSRGNRTRARTTLNKHNTMATYNVQVDPHCFGDGPPSKKAEPLIKTCFLEIEGINLNRFQQAADVADRVENMKLFKPGDKSKKSTVADKTDRKTATAKEERFPKSSLEKKQKNSGGHSQTEEQTHTRQNVRKAHTYRRTKNSNQKVNVSKTAVLEHPFPVNANLDNSRHRRKSNKKTKKPSSPRFPFTSKSSTKPRHRPDIKTVGTKKKLRLPERFTGWSGDEQSDVCTFVESAETLDTTRCSELTVHTGDSSLTDRLRGLMVVHDLEKEGEEAYLCGYVPEEDGSFGNSNPGGDRVKGSRRPVKFDEDSGRFSFVPVEDDSCGYSNPGDDRVKGNGSRRPVKFDEASEGFSFVPEEDGSHGYSNRGDDRGTGNSIRRPVKFDEDSGRFSFVPVEDDSYAYSNRGDDRGTGNSIRRHDKFDEVSRRFSFSDQETPYARCPGEKGAAGLSTSLASGLSEIEWVQSVNAESSPPFMDRWDFTDDDVPLEGNAHLESNVQEQSTEGQVFQKAECYGESDIVISTLQETAQSGNVLDATMTLDSSGANEKTTRPQKPSDSTFRSDHRLGTKNGSLVDNKMTYKVYSISSPYPELRILNSDF